MDRRKACRCMCWSDQQAHQCIHQLTEPGMCSCTSHLATICLGLRQLRHPALQRTSPHHHHQRGVQLPWHLQACTGSSARAGTSSSSHGKPLDEQANILKKQEKVVRTLHSWPICNTSQTDSVSADSLRVCRHAAVSRPAVGCGQAAG